MQAGKKIAVVIAALTLSALCACAGTKFSYDRARQVQVGMSEADVTRLLGRPYMVSSKGETQLWIWSYYNGMSGASKSVTFTMQDGKVSSVPTIPASFK